MQRRVNEELNARDERRGALRMVIPAEWNQVTESIIGAAIEVHRELGPGLLEKIYEEAFVHELQLRGMRVQRQVPIRLKYKGIELPEQRLDVIVNDLVVVELKSVESVSDVNLAQLVGYLCAADAPLGLLVNFNMVLLTRGVYRRINPAASAAKALQTMSHSVSL